MEIGRYMLGKYSNFLDWRAKGFKIIQGFLYHCCLLQTPPFVSCYELLKLCCCLLVLGVTFMFNQIAASLVSSTKSLSNLKLLQFCFTTTGKSSDP